MLPRADVNLPVVFLFMENSNCSVASVGGCCCCLANVMWTGWVVWKLNKTLICPPSFAHPRSNVPCTRTTPQCYCCPSLQNRIARPMYCAKKTDGLCAGCTTPLPGAPALPSAPLCSHTVSCVLHLSRAARTKMGAQTNTSLTLAYHKKLHKLILTSDGSKCRVAAVNVAGMLMGPFMSPEAHASLLPKSSQKNSTSLHLSTV